MGEPLRSLARDLAQGRATARAVAESCLARIEAEDPRIQAWVPFDAGGALARAENSLLGKPLSGTALGVKDIYDTAELPTEWGSEVYKGRQSQTDAALVAELKRLGAYVLGKTQTTAFAFYDPAPTRNPHNLEHTPGGSSSGSAAAVAAGMVPLALGVRVLPRSSTLEKGPLATSVQETGGVPREAFLANSYVLPIELTCCSRWGRQARHAPAALTLT